MTPEYWGLRVPPDLKGICDPPALPYPSPLWAACPPRCLPFPQIPLPAPGWTARLMLVSLGLTSPFLSVTTSKAMAFFTSYLVCWCPPHLDAQLRLAPGLRSTHNPCSESSPGSPTGI